MKKLLHKIKQTIIDIQRFIQYGDLPTSYYIKKGMKVGKHFSRESGTKMDISNCWLIEIKDNVKMANRVQILAHDDAAEPITGYRKVGKVIIGNNVFIGAGVTILPGVIIGDNAIIGAGSLVNRSVKPNMLVAGVPIRDIKTVDQFIKEAEEDLRKAELENRMIDMTYDVNCKPSKEINPDDLKEETSYYFKITRFANQE